MRYCSVGSHARGTPVTRGLMGTQRRHSSCGNATTRHAVILGEARNVLVTPKDMYIVAIIVIERWVQRANWSDFIFLFSYQLFSQVWKNVLNIKVSCLTSAQYTIGNNVKTLMAPPKSFQTKPKFLLQSEPLS